jgi:hypothetical protein
MATFQSKQDSYRDYFTGIQFGLAVLFDLELWEAFLAQETESVRKIPPRPFSHPHPTVSRKASVNSELRKRWSDFCPELAKDLGDKSVADMKYTLYLLRKGLDSDEIRRRLLNESLLIENRKVG